MKDYFVWSLHQLYLIIFWPTRFRQEVEGASFLGQPKLSYAERLIYLFKMLPWTLTFAIVGNLVVGRIVETLGVHYLWIPSWGGLAMGLVAGLILGVISGVAIGLASSIAAGVILAVPAAEVIGTSPENWLRYLIGLFASLFVIIIPGLLVRNKRFLAERTSIIPVLILAIVVTLMAGTSLAVGIFAPISGTLLSITVPQGLAISIAAAASAGLMTGFSSGAVFGMTRGLAFGLAFVPLMSIAGALAFGVLGGTIFIPEFGMKVGLAFLITFPISTWLAYFRLLNYPLDVGLSILSYLSAIQGRAIESWRWNPVSWNEVVWLPLPLVSKLLVLCIREDPDVGFSTLAFVVAERPLQRRTALDALIEIIIGELRMETAIDIAAMNQKLNWVSNAPTELPAELIASVSRFDRASRHVEQYFSITSDYQRRAALKRAIEEIESLQLNLISAVGQTTPRLLYAANHWHRVLKSEHDHISEARGLEEIPNPFIFGRPIEEIEQNVFMGRADIASQIEGSVLSAVQTPTLLLQGARRMGKTSILKQLPKLLGPDFAPSILDCQDAEVRTGAAAFFHHLSLSIAEGLYQRRVSVRAINESALEREPFVVFGKWLRAIEDRLPSKMRVLICLDEYEWLQTTFQFGWGLELLNTLRHWIQYRPRIVLMFCGAQTFSELGPAWTNRFINARRVRVSFLQREDVELLLTKPIPEFNMTYTPEALEETIRMAHCQPFLTQAIAFELVQLLNQDHRKEANENDVETAISAAFESADAYFSNVWTDAGEEGQRILLGISRGQKPDCLTKRLNWLREHDILNAKNDFAVPMVERWVREYKSH